MSRLTPGDDRGLGLVELLVVVTITSILGVVVLTGILQAFTTTREGQERIYTLTDLTAAAERVTRELRAADPVVLAEPTHVQVEVLRNGHLELHDFTASTGVLLHTVTRYTDAVGTAVATTDSSELVPGLVVPSSGVFSFTAAGGGTWVDTQPVAELVRIDFALNAALDDQEPLSLSTAVFVRNHGT